MKYRKTFLSILSLSLIVSCGGYDSVGLSDENSTEAKRYEILKALDEGNYDFVISNLEKDPTYGGAFSTEEGKLNLAAAYIGKAGLDINGIINIMIDTADRYTGDAFTAFLESLSSQVKTKGSLYLKRAYKVYDEIVQTCTPEPPDEIKKQACFYKDIVNATRAATTLNSVVSNVTSWLNPVGCEDDANQNGVGDDGEITACAIEYAVSRQCTLQDVNIESVKDITFTKDNFVKTYTLLEISVNPNGECSAYGKYTGYKLVDTETSTVVATEGYCKSDFSPCENLDLVNGCYPCPIVDIETGETVNVVEDIVESLQNADEIINTIAPDSDVSQSVNEYIEEVCGLDKVCTQDEIADYLTNINQNIQY